MHEVHHQPASQPGSSATFKCFLAETISYEGEKPRISHTMRRVARKNPDWLLPRAVVFAFHRAGRTRRTRRGRREGEINGILQRRARALRCFYQLCVINGNLWARAPRGWIIEILLWRGSLDSLSLTIGFFFFSLSRWRARNQLFAHFTRSKGVGPVNWYCRAVSTRPADRVR